MSLQLYISYLNKHIVTLDINISLRLLPSVNTLNSKWKFKTILINKSQLLLKALYLEATLGTDRLFRPGGGGRGGVQKGVVYQNCTLSPPKIIALENCTPLCQGQFLKSTHPTPPPSSPFKSLLPSLQGVDFISYIKIPIVSSVGWDLKVHARKKLVRGSGACSTRKFLNLGSQKCHLLRFLYDIFSK